MQIQVTILYHIVHKKCCLTIWRENW